MPDAEYVSGQGQGADQAINDPEPSGVSDVESAIDYIVESCDPESKRDAEALRSTLYNKLNYRVGHFLAIDNAALYALSDAELGARTRDLRCAKEDIACEGFQCVEVSAGHKR